MSSFIVVLITALMGTSRDVFAVSNSAPACASSPPREDFLVGGKAIKLPGLFEAHILDGLPAIGEPVDIAPIASHRFLAFFSTLNPNRADSVRGFNAQVPNSLENTDIDENAFAEIKRQTRLEIQRARDTVRQKVEKRLADVDTRMYDVTGIDAVLSVGDVAALGCFDDSQCSLGFTTAINALPQIGGKLPKIKTVIASIIVLVNGRVIQLNASTDYKLPEDRQWAQNAVIAWRDMVVAANSGEKSGAPAKASVFNGLRWPVVICTLVGAGISLLGVLCKKQCKP